MSVLRFTGPDGVFVSRVLPALSSRGIPPHLVSMAGDSALVLLERPSLEDRLLDELKGYGATEVFSDKSSITVVGEGVSTLAGRISALLTEGSLMMMSGPASSASLTFVIDTKHLEPLILKLHRALIEESPDPELFDPVGL